MKCKMKFNCKQPWQTGIECSLQRLIPHDWYCSIAFGALPFSVFVWQLAMCNWHLLLYTVPVNLFSTFEIGSSTKSAACWMPSHSNFFVVHVEETSFFKIPAEVICRCAWNIWIIFQLPHGFPIDSSCIQHIR